ncbi:hypothetical protein FRC11_007085, partial [Ceratobasidium sp. 423]
MPKLEQTPGRTINPDTDAEPPGEPPCPKPLNVLVFGPTGAGKSTIINLLTNNSAQLPVGHDLESCTADVSFASIDYKGRSIKFFDTAGFDDTDKAPAEHLSRLIRRLDEMYNLANGRPHIHGVFYIHNINANRMTQSTKMNLRVIQELLGDHLLRNLVFVTNMWDPKPKPRHVRLEQELIQKDEYFGMAIKQGARAGATYRIYEDASHAEAQEALLDLFWENNPGVLQIQSEVAGRDGVEIAATKAGKVLREGLRELARAMRVRLEGHEIQLKNIPETQQEGRQNLRGKIGDLQVMLRRVEDQDFLLGATIGFLRRAIPEEFAILSAVGIVGGGGLITGANACLEVGLFGMEVASA